jgi:hypothetical protein
MPPGEIVQETNGHPPRKVVKKFSCQSGKDTSIVVEVVENKFQTQSGEDVTNLCAVCSRPYVKVDGQLGTSYSYRHNDVPLLIHLLQKAHAFMLDHRLIEDDPV